jgi:hypothetical protein
MNVTETVHGFQLDDDLARDYEVYTGASYDYTLETGIEGKLRREWQPAVSERDAHGCVVGGF